MTPKMFLVQPSCSGLGHMPGPGSLRAHSASSRGVYFVIFEPLFARTSRTLRGQKGKAHAHYQGAGKDHGQDQSVPHRKHAREAASRPPGQNPAQNVGSGRDRDRCDVRAPTNAPDQPDENGGPEKRRGNMEHEPRNHEARGGAARRLAKQGRPDRRKWNGRTAQPAADRDERPRGRGRGHGTDQDRRC